MKPRLKKKKGGYASIEEEQKPSSKPMRKSKRTPKRSGKNNAATQIDYRLRQAVEGDGTRTIIDIESDGNCLFRAISDQLYHDFGNNHAQVRHEICDFIAGHKDDFAVFLVLDDKDAANAEEEDARDFETYVHNMRQDGDWGGHLELVAAARMYRRNITVFSANLDAYTVDHGSSAKSAGPDLLVSYHDNDHYNSVRDSCGGKPPPPIRTYVVDHPEPMAVDGNVNNVDNANQNHTVSAHDGPCGVHADMMATEQESGALTTSTSNGSIEVALRGTSAATAVSTSSDSNTQQKPKKGDFCPCGSGQRYKKCCYLSEKRMKRRQREHSITTGQSMPKEVQRRDSTEMNGDFRVLKI